LRQTALHKWLPPEAVRVGSHWLGRRVRFLGDYPSWEAAAREAEGYGADTILAKSREATEMARSGRAAEARDGMALSHAANPYPLLTALLRAAALNEGRLRVLDFGGALGGTYFACRPFLRGLAEVRWIVVEQPHFVRCGRKLFADDVLDFLSSIEEAFALRRPDLVILSSVLQYLEDPYAILASVVRHGVAQVVIDRTPVVSGRREIITLQRVPARILRSSYPARLFTRESLLSSFEPGYRLAGEFEAIDEPVGGLTRRVRFVGYLLEREVS
jgi:putative methyltransferase (TIGR04325 family)